MFQSRVEVARLFGITLEAGEGIRVACSPGLASYRIVTRAGRVLGEIHGRILRAAADPAISIATGPAGDRGTITVPDAVTDCAVFETVVLDQIRGSFAALTHTTLPPRLYPDCAGTVPIVYCARTRRAASSAGMLFDAVEYRTRFLADRHRRLVEAGAFESWIPGPLTAHEGLARLLPNHYLDLADWRPVRFWPRPDFATGCAPEAAVEIVAERMQGFIAAAADEARVGVTLTAGFDSRMVLAASRSVAGRLEYFTFTPPRPGLDQIRAGELATRLGLAHRLMPLVAATPAEQEAWDRAVGHVITHPNRQAHPSLRPLDHDLILTGIRGETGRARLYRHDWATIDTRPATVSLVLSRLGQPQDPELVAALEPWLAGIAHLPTSLVLDLAVLELFFATLWRPAQCAEALELLPFADRAVQTAFLSVPPEAKGEDRLFVAAIRAMWPEALDLPVNRFGDYRDPLSLVAKGLQPARLASFLRRRFA